LVDELEKMLPIKGIQDGFTGYIDFFGYIRGLSQEEGTLVSIVTAANPSITEDPQWGGQDNPVFKFYQELFLPPFQRSECDEMIIKLGRGMGMLYAAKSLTLVYEKSGGHPFIARQLCSRIATMYKDRPLHVQPSHVGAAADDFVRDDSSTFKEILARLESYFPEEKNILGAIVRGSTTEEQLTERFGKDVALKLRHLVGYQLIERNERAYKTKIGLLDTWLRKHWLASAG
jgi:hypothetical protein